MDLDDKELFSSAMTADENPEVTDTPAEAPETEAPQQEERTRDEQGRFAKQVEPEPKPEQAEPARDEAHVPPWRLREIKEERDAINQRYLETQRQLEMLQRQNAPKPEPTPAPDLFENPTGFAKHYAQEVAKEAMSPLERRLQAAEARLEANSRREAFKEFGQETVKTAYSWLVNGMQSQDPNVFHTYNQAMQSDHPYETIVNAYQELSFVQQVRAAGGPDKWREQQFAAQSQAQPQGNNRQQSNGSSQGNSIVKLPPSMRNLPASQLDGDDESDMSDAAMFRQAMR